MSAHDDVTAPRDAILRWFDGAARRLPWRETRDPWAIWVSEVMLQQTRVETVIPYFERFLRRFPTPEALAAASEPEVLALWSGLGYYRRARFLHAGARRVAEAHGGEVPRDPAALRALPGVGDYTAGAIGSIAFGLPMALVDGNVERVLTRLHALAGDPRAPAGRKRLWALAARYADHPRPGDVNQSLMELGATVCAPTAPRCLTCPARPHCAAARAGEPTRYPEKVARAAPREERWVALVATRADRVWLVPSALGRWEGMLVPPLAPARDGASTPWPATLLDVRPCGSVTHVLTHARMTIEVTGATLAAPPAEGRLVSPDELDGLAVPKVTRRVLSRAGWPAG